jgi:tetratricopeptide (TPR) repeat protein
MSVLYKALQKAEKENEQRQTISSGKGFDPERLAGSGAIKRAGGPRLNWRILGFSAVGLLAVLVLGLYLVTQTQTPPQPRVAMVAQSSPAASPSTAQSPVPVPTSGVPAPPQEQASQATAAAQPQAQPPSSQVAQAQGAASETSNVASPAQTAAASSPAITPPATDAAKSEAAATEVAKTEAPAMSDTQAPAEASQPSGAVASTRASTLKQPVAASKPVAIPRDSPAQMLSPPISVARADFALSGVGNAVQVRQIAKDAQDNVGAGYNALLRGEYDTALGFYDRALQKEPTSVLALLGRGAALQKLHRLDEARDAYSNALKIDPENREALTNITSIVAERSPAEALNVLLDLEKHYPAFSPIKAQIGLLYAKTGSMEQALDYLRRAAALSPDATMYQYNLALVLDHMNLREQAVSAYEHVLSSISVGQAPPELSSSNIERRVRYLRTR